MKKLSKSFLTLTISLTFVLLMFSSSAYAIAKVEGLVLYLSFDDNDKIIEDLSGTGHDAENNGAKSVEGKYGSALEFGGVDTWVIVPNAPDLNFGPDESLTAMVWAKVIGPPSGQGNLLAKYAVGAGTTPFYGMFHNSNNKVHAYVRDGGGNLLDPWSKDIISDDEWHHIALVRDTDDNKVFLYVDGELDFDGDDVTNDLTNDFPVAIGRHTSEFLVGIVDEVMIFRRALDEAEIQNSMDPKNMLAVSSYSKLATKWGGIKK